VENREKKVNRKGGQWSAGCIQTQEAFLNGVYRRNTEKLTANDGVTGKQYEKKGTLRSGGKGKKLLNPLHPGGCSLALGG